MVWISGKQDFVLSHPCYRTSSIWKECRLRVSSCIGVCGDGSYGMEEARKTGLHVFSIVIEVAGKLELWNRKESENFISDSQVLPAGF